MALMTLTDENFDETINDHAIVVIDFWANWCGPCKSFSPVFEKVASEITDVTFAKVDVDAQTQLAQDFNIRSIPQLMVIREGVVVFAESGVLPESALKDLVEQAKQLDMPEVHKAISEQKGDAKE